MRSLARVGLLGFLGIVVGTGGCTRTDAYAVTVARAIYVSPQGDDSNPGTLAQPLKTVAKARDLVRAEMRAMTTDMTVYLRGGTYPQTSTLTFSNADSGNGGFYVKYVAYPSERPLITGGQPITGWKLVDATSNLHSASVGVAPFRQLYVDGVKAVRARSPNLAANNAPSFNKTTGADKSAHTVQVASSAVGNWSNLTKVEMHLMTSWAENTLRLAQVTSSGNNAVLKLQSPEDPILFVRPNPGLGSSEWYYFENALEMLDQPGEWYLDETAMVVYYKPRAGEDMATAVVVAPQLETIMSVIGTSTSEQASHLWFEGLAFAHSTYLRPSQFGFLDGQAGQYNLTAEANNDQTVGRPPAGVSVMNANHIHFERNMFTQMAATGLDLVSGTRDDLIIGNVLTQIGGSGISVGKFVADEATEYHIPYKPSDKNEICTNDTIKDNYISDVTTELQGACGIACGYPATIDIEHNEVTGTNFTGISVGYGWTGAKNAMTNNRINYNNIHHVANLLAGGAGISTISNQGPTSEIEYNYLHDFGQSQWADYAAQGVYLDTGTTGYTVAHNVMVNTPGLLTAPNAGNNTLTDNGPNLSGAQDTMSSAGIEPDYLDIKNLPVPVATF